MTTFRFSLLLAFIALLCVPNTARAAESPLASRDLSSIVAQVPAPNVVNPSGYDFTASLDHATIDRYEVDILKADGTLLQTLNIGKPTPNASNVISAPLNVQPVSFGVNYSLQARACAGTVCSDNAPSVNKFDRKPGKPGGGTAK